MKKLFLNLAPYRLRILFRVAFLLLASATIYLALFVLQQEKQLSYKNYQHSFLKTKEQISATLRHPTGQLALLNPPKEGASLTPLHPLVLPFSAIDFDDQNKVQQAVAMSGCHVQYGDDGSLCVAVGNNPWAGGFIYVAGSFVSGELVAHDQGDLQLRHAHRVKVEVALRGQTYRWIAPFETTGNANATRKHGVQGRLAGFIDSDPLPPTAKPVKEFRGWVWQNADCIASSDTAETACERSSFFSMRLPIGVLQDALFQEKHPVWPPADLDKIAVHIEVLAPGDGEALLDSNSDDAVPPFSVNDLKSLLLPGETLEIKKLSSPPNVNIISMVGTTEKSDDSFQFVNRLVRKLPVEEYDAPIDAREKITTLSGAYEVILKGDVRSVNKSLAVVVTRVSWFVGGMLLAILLAWVVIEIGIIRRITALTKRTKSLSSSVKSTSGLDQFNLSDLRGDDELGVLASCLHDLLRRVKEDAEREGIRAEQEKEMWHAVGHEIMSPLQSLMVLHGASDDQSKRYIYRMQQAVRVLYGSASPSEAFQSTVLQVTAIDIDAFLKNAAANAPCVGIANINFIGEGTPIMVRADDYSLEDVITHVLGNADRCREPGSPISITLTSTETAAGITIHNQGAHIPEDLIDKIFEYGVSDQQDAGANGNRGQGLFVAKTYMAKMGGTIAAHNVDGGVSFVLSLQRVTGAPAKAAGS